MAAEYPKIPINGVIRKMCAERRRKDTIRIFIHKRKILHKRQREVLDLNLRIIMFPLGYWHM